jgi:hypothetical protein
LCFLHPDYGRHIGFALYGGLRLHILAGRVLHDLDAFSINRRKAISLSIATLSPVTCSPVKESNRLSPVDMSQFVIGKKRRFEISGCGAAI